MNNDLISREALKKALKSNCDLCNDKNTLWCERCCPHNDFEDLIENAPTVEQKYYERIIAQINPVIEERPQGEWIKFADYVARNVVSEDFSEDIDFYAEVLCRKLVKLGLVKLDGDTYKYCGADMKGGAE